MKPLTQILAITLCLSTQAFASPSVARGEIEKSYEKMSRAVKLKYVDGILAVRTPDYERRGLSGERIQDSTERTLLLTMFAKALTMRQAVKVIDFRMKGESKVLCRVQIHTEMVLPATIPKPPQTMLVDTVSQDVWVLTRDGWRIQSDRLLSETVRQSTQPSVASPTSSPSPK